jgi:hypothetical protein
LAVGKPGVPKHSRQKSAPRESGKNTQQRVVFSNACDFPVRVTGAPVELGGGCAIVLCIIASDNHISYIMTRPYLYLIYHCTYIWPQLRARCAGKEAVPSTCVGGARPCDVGVPQRPRQVRANQPCPNDHAKSERTRSVLALAAVGALLRCSSGARGTMVATFIELYGIRVPGIKQPLFIRFQPGNKGPSSTCVPSPSSQFKFKNSAVWNILKCAAV